MKEFVVINEKDNVGVRLAATDKIPAEHKFALKDIKKKYALFWTKICTRTLRTSDLYALNCNRAKFYLTKSK